MKIEEIVLIDDDADEYMLFADAIKSIDGSIQIRHVAEPISDVDSEKCTLPHLVFLDINMPRRDGFEWLKWIRQQQFAMPIIMYSTSKSEDKIALSYQLGADLYLTKPMDFDELIRSLQTILNFDWSQPVKIKNHYYSPHQCRSFSLSN